MKNNYLLFLLLSALAGYGQLATEGFENSGTSIPSGWQRLNVSGPAWQWKLSNPADSDQPPYQGTYAAYMFRENVVEGMTAEDWLVTKQFVIPENARLTFYSRLLYNGDQQTTYRVMLHMGATPFDISAYTQLQQWTELEINPEQLQYTEVNVHFPAASFGEAAYIAFVMNGDYGDGWLIDDVGVQGTMGNEEADIVGLSIYPNPVKDHCIIKGINQLESLKVFDSNGRECITKSNKEIIDMSGLVAGLYIVRAVTDKGVVIRKVIKE